MKLILLLAVVGLGYASFCENESAFSIREIVKPLIVNQLEDIFGYVYFYWKIFTGIMHQQMHHIVLRDVNTKTLSFKDSQFIKQK